MCIYTLTVSVVSGFAYCTSARTNEARLRGGRVAAQERGRVLRQWCCTRRVPIH